MIVLVSTISNYCQKYTVEPWGSIIIESNLMRIMKVYDSTKYDILSLNGHVIRNRLQQSLETYSSHQIEVVAGVPVHQQIQGANFTEDLIADEVGVRSWRPTRSERRRVTINHGQSDRKIFLHQSNQQNAMIVILMRCIGMINSTK